MDAAELFTVNLCQKQGRQNVYLHNAESHALSERPLSLSRGFGLGTDETLAWKEPSWLSEWTSRNRI